MLSGLNPGEKLESFIDRKVRPPDDFREKMNYAVDKLVRHIHGLPGYSIQEVVKSGSLGKGTTTMASADADIVVFFNEYSTIENLISAKPSILRALENHLIRYEPTPEWLERIQVLKKSEYHVSFRIHLRYHSKPYHIECDALPAIDIFARHGDISEVYKEMKTKTEAVRSHYSVCLCKLQLALFRQKPAKLKDLIRLLKYWYKTNDLYMASYCFEIIGLYVFNTDLKGNERFDMKDGFIKALERLSSYPNIRVVDSPYYAPGSGDGYCNIPGPPCVLDPVNPFSNTARPEPKMSSYVQETLRSLRSC